MVSTRPTAGLLAFALLSGCAAPPPEPVPEPVEPGAIAFPPAPESPAALADTWYAECGPRTEFPLAELLPAIAQGLMRQKIPYSRAHPEEWRDCSGNFLRFSSYVASACPPGMPELAAPPGILGYVAGASNVVDLEPEARSSRDLARWFQDHGRFVPVYYDEEDPADTLDRYRYLIKAGSVLWFSRDAPTSEGGVDQLFSKGTRIHHVGAVVAVDRDDEGDVIGYSMYHGGNTSRVATVTDEHRFEPTGSGPPFGNGDDYLVAIGSLLPLAPPPAE